MRSVVAGSLALRWIVVFLAGVVLAVGFVQIPQTQVDVFPEFAPPRIEIQTIALGNSSNEVEQLITVPIEDQLGGLPGLEDMRSKSVAQLSSIELIFDRGTDELRARQLVAERIAQITATLPTWASPPFLMPALSSTSRIMKIGMSSAQVDLVEMSTLAYWKIRARLLRVPGVAQVAIYGERLPQRHVQVDPARLAEHDVTLQEVMTAGSDALDAGLLRYSDGAVVGTGGFVEGEQRLNVRHVQPILGPEQLGKVPVVERDGKVLRMADLGQVLVDPGPLIGDAVINDGPGLMLIVQKYRGANTLEVTRGVEQALGEMRPGLPGIELDSTLFRPATFIEQSIDNLTWAMLVGILLVVLVILAFLFEWRTAFISLLAIPLSLVAALLVLDAAGATVNVMVLAGLVVALDVVVDDAIIDVENIVRRLREAREQGSGDSTWRIVLEASVEVRSAITYATLINVVAVVPVLFLQGLSGSFFQPLVLSYGLAVLVSMVVALTLTPALCLLLLSRGGPVRGESPAAAGAQARLRAGAVPAAAPALAGGRRGAGRDARRAARRPHAGQPAAAELQGARLPHALAHAARHVAGGGVQDLRRRLPGSARDPRRAQLRVPHRPGAARRRGVRGRPRRELDQRRSGRGLRHRARAGARDRRALSGPVPRRADLSARAHQGGAHRQQRVDRRPPVRPRPRHAARQGRGDREAHRRGPRRGRRARRSPDRSAAHRGGARPRRGPPARSQAR